MLHRYGEVACGIICCCLPIIPLFWHHISHSTGTRNITLGNMNKASQNPQSTRAALESYDTNSNWVRLDDGTITSKRAVNGTGKAHSDEVALNEAVLGISNKV